MYHLPNGLPAEEQTAGADHDHFRLLNTGHTFLLEFAVMYSAQSMRPGASIDHAMHML